MPPGPLCGSLTLTNSIGMSTTFQWNGAPLPVFLNPAAGPALGGNTVTIIGAAFRPSITVDFGGTPAAIQSHTVSMLTITVPPGSPGPVPITITTPSGCSGALNYTYQ